MSGLKNFWAFFKELTSLCSNKLQMKLSIFKSFKLTFKLFTSTSTNLGLSQDWIIGQRDVDQQRAGIRHSSPGFNLFFFNGFVKAKNAKRYADEPELTIKQYLDLINFENFFSNSNVFLDMVSLMLLTTLMAELISLIEKAFSKSGYLNGIYVILITKFTLKKLNKSYIILMF